MMKYVLNYYNLDIFIRLLDSARLKVIFSKDRLGPSLKLKARARLGLDKVRLDPGLLRKRLNFGFGSESSHYRWKICR